MREADEVPAILAKEGADLGRRNFKVHLSCDFPSNVKDLQVLSSRFSGIFIPARKLRRFFLGRLEKPLKEEDEDLDLGAELTNWTSSVP
jgi:hypothetical protein